MMTADDAAARFRVMYLTYCQGCRDAGIPVPTPEEWVECINEQLREDAREARESAKHRFGFRK